MILKKDNYRPPLMRIFCKVIEPDPVSTEKKTKGGLWVVETKGSTSTKAPDSLATVISWGSKVETPLKEGDVIYYSPFCGQKFLLEDEEYIILTEGDIVGIFDKDVD